VKIWHFESGEPAAGTTVSANLDELANLRKGATGNALRVNGLSLSTLLATDDPQSFDEAAAAAENNWPGQTEWDLMANDYPLTDPIEGIGSRTFSQRCTLGMPLTIARFSTFDGDGSNEDPAGESDY
jgi:hypothetical protein